MVCKFSTVVELLRYRSVEQGNTEAFTFLHDGEAQAATLNYRELDRYSRAIASQLQILKLTGRALLLYPPGIDYLPAFFGCLYAGVVAVPAYPPRNQRNTPRILAILKDAQTAVILTTTAILSQLKSLLADKFDLDSIRWLTTDNLAPGIEEAWQEPLIDIDTLAFLQYTSGSTGIPKGVMLSHGNLLHNAVVTRQYMEHSANSKFVSWLPVYHDMGLIGGVLQPLYGGFPCMMMPPAAFLQRPYRWLQAISRYRGTTSGAPNFAYELCIEKITPEQRSTLDLSSWSVAFNGAEPIRQQTLERFAATFAECGFRPEAFYPCYGMAEATLMVSGSVKSALVRCKNVNKSALERNYVIDAVTNDDNSIVLVSCGRSVPQQQIVIVNAETFTRCQDKEVGEIWVSGPSVGKGYWNRQTETEQTFHAFLQDIEISEASGPFLRTGDLGFLDSGEVFITGRAKDLIIIRGRNLYPQDIELTAERSHPALRLGSSAAFAVEVENEEKLVVVQELEFRAKPNLEEVTAAIRQAVSQEFEMQVYAVVLIKPGTIPKTSSGKIQRRATKAEFLAGTLNVVQSSILDSFEVNLTKKQPTNIETYLQQLVAQVLSVPLEQINIQQPLSNLGIDSLQAFELKNRIQEDVGVCISAVDLFEASIAEIVKLVLSTEINSINQQLQPVSRDCELPLCLAQERLWFLDQLEPGNPFYNVAIAIRLTGKLNPVILEQSLNEIIKRHESLRTTFPTIDGRPIQVIHETLELKLSILQNFDSDIQSLILEESQKPFDLDQLPLLRATLLHLKEDKHLLLISTHHIISDGWSIGVLIQELATIYAAFSLGKPSPLPELSIQYADYAYWQRQWLQTDVLQPQLDYWKQQLNGSAPLLQLPTDRPRPAIQTFKGKKEFFSIAGEIKEAVKNLNKQEGVTLFMTLLAVFKTLLYCYNKQEDILVGSPVLGRNWRETENLIGFFINTLVFRTDFSGNPSFREVLQRLRACALDAYAHQDLPFEKLVEELQPERNLSYNPLFQVMFILQNAPIPAIEINNLNMHPQEVDIGTSKFDLKFSIWESKAGFQGSMEYKVDLFNAVTIASMNNHFEILLKLVVDNPNIQVSELGKILNKNDRKQQLVQAKELESTSLQKLKLTKRKSIHNL
ncbi:MULTISPECIES: condensation domain-containing protein [unclassified Nostoc]|uniref:condensation domain-containing protein n=1 Tax=unclassified Nostoc TaxID=2593658 RepID=UPI002AD32F3C|nr:condensation domain-containing protein [Nostoc sp. DedQUE03]MDZ7975475.1 condensation domain-containing protein [Nostoc sp. DedQUE03]MDZ8045523.1 condensation domain-containing protein [Nostoc sp. DedQUE02]